MPVNIGHLLTNRARLSPNKEGLVCEDVRRTYKEMNARSNQLAIRELSKLRKKRKS